MFAFPDAEREKREGVVVGTCHCHTKKDKVEEPEPGSATQRRYRRGVDIRNGSGSSSYSRMEISSGSSSRRWLRRRSLSRKRVEDKSQNLSMLVYCSGDGGRVWSNSSSEINNSISGTNIIISDGNSSISDVGGGPRTASAVTEA